MLYPPLNSAKTQRLWTEQFMGLDRRPRALDGTFRAMGNMAGEPGPLIKSRGKRGVVAELEKPLGLLSLGKLAWIDGSTLYYNGAATAINDLSLEEHMLPKRMTAMGSYIIIWPDKVYYNTIDPADAGRLERLYETARGETVHFTLCDMDGIDYPRTSMTESVDAPTDPDEGDYWLNTGVSPHALYQWGGVQNSWVGVSSVYVKIEAEDIGSGLSAGDGVTISGISYTGDSDEMKTQLESLNETMIVQAADDDYIVVIGILDENWNQTEGRIRVDRTAPELDFLIENNNRLWGCRYGEENGEFVNRIYACTLGDFRNWRKYGGTSLDSYYVNVGSDGPFTGAVSHRGTPLFFKENCVHRIFGDIPASYEMQTTLCDGVQEGSGGTVAPYNGAIFYLGRHGVQLYESLPQGVSKALGEGKMSLGQAGQADGKYYLSAKEEAGGFSLYVLDTDNGIWYREDDARAVAFAELNGEIYMLCENGILYALNGQAGTKEPEDVTWYLESAVMGYEYPDHQYLGRFVLRMRLGETAACRLMIQYDSDGIWRDKGILQGKGRVKTYLAPIVPRRCEHMQIRIEGHGDMTLYGIAREIVMGSDGR